MSRQIVRRPRRNRYAAYAHMSDGPRRLADVKALNEAEAFELAVCVAAQLGLEGVAVTATRI